MSQPVTAEVVDAPKPERPELWVEVYRECYAAKPDEWWWETRLSETQQEADEFHARLPGGITIHVPASTAAPEPDWVAELVSTGRWLVISKGSTLKFSCAATLPSGKGLLPSEEEETEDERVYGEGPTPNLAAKACVENLRGAT